MTITTTTTLARRAAAIGAAVLTVVISGCGGSDTKAAGSNPSTSASSVATTTTAPAGTAVAFENAPPQPTLLTPACSATDPADCVTPLTYGSADVHGDLTGTAVAAGAVSLYKASTVGAVLLAFRGTVAGCGTGRVMLVGTGDVSTGEWKVIEKSGSDDLRSLTGGGTYTVDSTGIHYKGIVHCT